MISTMLLILNMPKINWTPVPVPHHAGEHQPRVDAPTVMPVPIMQSPQLTSVPNNDDGVVKPSRGRIIRKPTYFKDFVQ